MTAASRANESLLSADEARRLFSYDKKTGELRWQVESNNHVKLGDIAGSIWTRVGKKQYWVVRVNGVGYAVHRIAWLIVTGEWPVHEIDHENGCGIDNKWRNLKCATRIENCRNQRLAIHNTSGASGVNWLKTQKRWRARINVNGKKISLGCFKEKSDAIAARKKAETELGYHKNHGSDRPL